MDGYPCVGMRPAAMSCIFIIQQHQHIDKTLSHNILHITHITLALSWSEYPTISMGFTTEILSFRAAVTPAAVSRCANVN